MGNLQPKIYVACLASYNNGILYGKWIDASQPVDDIRNEINKMLADSPMVGAEEWAIHDYEDFGSIDLSESEDLDTMSEIVAFIREHGDAGTEILNYHGNDLESAKRSMEEYCGAYDSEEDFARGLMEDCYEIPDYLENYINYESFARDLFVNDYLSLEKDYKIHVFRTI